jgi:hypothetical protein
MSGFRPTRQQIRRPKRVTSVDELVNLQPCDGIQTGMTRATDDDLFVDSSGWGLPGEPALTLDQFKARIGELLTVHPVLYVGVTEIGQFQCYVGVWH